LKWFRSQEHGEAAWLHSPHLTDRVRTKSTASFKSSCGVPLGASVCVALLSSALQQVPACLAANQRGQTCEVRSERFKCCSCGPLRVRHVCVSSIARPGESQRLPDGHRQRRRSGDQRATASCPRDGPSDSAAMDRSGGWLNEVWREIGGLGSDWRCLQRS